MAIYYNWNHLKNKYYKQFIKIQIFIFPLKKIYLIKINKNSTTNIRHNQMKTKLNKLCDCTNVLKFWGKANSFNYSCSKLYFHILARISLLVTLGNFKQNWFCGCYVFSGLVWSGIALSCLMVDSRLMFRLG
jgi:hypothetical protein